MGDLANIEKRIGNSVTESDNPALRQMEQYSPATSFVIQKKPSVRQMQGKRPGHD